MTNNKIVLFNPMANYKNNDLDQLLVSWWNGWDMYDSVVKIFNEGGFIMRLCFVIEERLQL